MAKVKAEISPLDSVADYLQDQGCMREVVVHPKNDLIDGIVIMVGGFSIWVRYSCNGTVFHLHY